MPDPPYEVGDSPRLRAAFTNLQGSAIDPSALSVQVRSPATGAVATYVYAGASPPTREATGAYYLDGVILDVGGVWQVKWRSSGPILVEEARMPVASSVF